MSNLGNSRSVLVGLLGALFSTDNRYVHCLLQPGPRDAFLQLRVADLTSDTSEPIVSGIQRSGFDLSPDQQAVTCSALEGDHTQSI